MTPTSTCRVFLGLGANIGNREENLRLALRWLAARCRIVAVSSLYGSPAVVPEGAAPGPDFVNAVVEVDTGIAPLELLAFAKEIERAIGRRPAPRWSARPIDIDILLWDADTIDEPELKVPHPHMHGRAFVLVPLAEIAPDAALPTLGRTAGQLAEDVDLTGLEHLAGPEWARIAETGAN
jgi:2-amino-4-hydroxy-6-hydroxymethyldihydropteridine diphosphokinase